MEKFILIISILLIVVSFISFNMRKRDKVKKVPEGLNSKFKEFCDLMGAPLRISFKEPEITKLNLIQEIPFDDGVFEFHELEYILEPEKPVVDKRGVVLNTKEIFEKAGFLGDPVLLLFRKETEMYEINFLSKLKILKIGYEEYIADTYSDDKKIKVDEEFKIEMGDQTVYLGQNSANEKPIESLEKILSRKNELLGNRKIYADTWESENIKMLSWVQFENKKSWIYFIKSTSPDMIFPRGIAVGSTIMELKKAYKGELAFDDDFKGNGRCYGYLARSKDKKYIAFFSDEEKIREIWMGEYDGDEPFKMKEGLVDDDIEWEFIDNRDKFTEKYAREMYIGQHKSEVYVEKVLNSFIARKLNQYNVKNTEILWEGIREKMYGLHCTKRMGEDEIKVDIEILMKREELQHSLTGDIIWIVDKFRVQEIDY